MKQRILGLLLLLVSLIIYGLDDQNLSVVIQSIIDNDLKTFNEHFVPDLVKKVIVYEGDYIDLLGIASQGKSSNTSIFIKKIIQEGGDPNRSKFYRPMPTRHIRRLDGSLEAISEVQSIKTLFPLERAIRAGNVLAVESLLKCGANIEQTSVSQSIWEKLFCPKPTPLSQAQKYESMASTRLSIHASGPLQVPGTRAEYMQIVVLLQQHLAQQGLEKSEYSCSVQ
ncbi:MAG: hypothetical protein WD055_05365 [Candidatus Dependentiae bacterium]